MALTEKELTSLWNRILNLSIQMLHNEEDALDATQSIFERVASQQHTFRGESQFSTWVYRIAYNYLIDTQRKKKKEPITFDLFEKDVTHFKDYENELNLSAEEEKLYIEEVKTGCTKAMLQCLDPQHRWVFILGNIFCVPQKEGAEICRLSYDNYRSCLSRSRKKIRNFMTKNCGLLQADAKCKCRKRLLIAKERGRINLEKSLYQSRNKRISQYIGEMNEMEDISKIYQDNPYIEWDIHEISRRIGNMGILQEVSEGFI